MSLKKAWKTRGICFSYTMVTMCMSSVYLAYVPIFGPEIIASGSISSSGSVAVFCVICSTM